MNIHSFYRPFLAYFRKSRIKQFYHLLDIDRFTSVIDIGGSLFFWKLASTYGLPIPKVIIVNLKGTVELLPGNIKWVVGEGRKLPFDDLSFDVAFCNSVIEHLGTKNDQLIFARELRRVGRRHYAQTPNSRFPIEPHLLTPFIHWLPISFQRKLIRNFTVWGVVTRPTREECERYFQEVKLLNRKEMVEMFPGSTVIYERFIGFQKSIIAISNNPIV